MTMGEEDIYINNVHRGPCDEYGNKRLNSQQWEHDHGFQLDIYFNIF